MISGNITEEAWRVKQERKKANTTMLSELFDIGYYTAVKKNYFWIQGNLPDMMSKRYRRIHTG